MLRAGLPSTSQYPKISRSRDALTVRDGKGRKDRITLVPEKMRSPLERHLVRVRSRHEEDLRAGAGSVELPYAIGRKYPRAAWEWAWQWVFPATRFYRRDPPLGSGLRHPYDPGAVGASRRENDHDLHPCPEPGWSGSP